VDPDAQHLFNPSARLNLTIPKPTSYACETDAVDVVVKATVARAGQIAAATENSIAEPAPPTAETSAGSSFFWMDIGRGVSSPRGGSRVETKLLSVCLFKQAQGLFHVVGLLPQRFRIPFASLGSKEIASVNVNSSGQT